MFQRLTWFLTLITSWVPHKSMYTIKNNTKRYTDRPKTSRNPMFSSRFRRMYQNISSADRKRMRQKSYILANAPELARVLHSSTSVAGCIPRRRWTRACAVNASGPIVKRRKNWIWESGKKFRRACLDGMYFIDWWFYQLINYYFEAQYPGMWNLKVKNTNPCHLRNSLSTETPSKHNDV